MAGTGREILRGGRHASCCWGCSWHRPHRPNEIRYVGQTSQDRKVVMKTDPRGAIKSWQGKLRATRAATEFADPE